MTKIKRITFLTNPNVCNLNCPLCFLNQQKITAGSPQKKWHDFYEMPLKILKTTFEKYATLKDESGNPILKEVIPSTMGEPLLYKNFDALLELCKIFKIKLNVTTNGTFPGRFQKDVELENLLKICNDIKISTLSTEGQFELNQWKHNVERLVKLQKKLLLNPPKNEADFNVSTISLQVTLHKKNLHLASKILQYAENLNINRIKWNKVVLLQNADDFLVKEFSLENENLEPLKSKLRSKKIRCEGNLFYGESAKSASEISKKNCPFINELWIFPDGTESTCPNPERRFGNILAENAKCENCIMKC